MDFHPPRPASSEDLIERISMDSPAGRLIRTPTRFARIKHPAHGGLEYHHRDCLIVPSSPDLVDMSHADRDQQHQIMMCCAHLDGEADAVLDTIAELSGFLQEHNVPSSSAALVVRARLLEHQGLEVFVPEADQHAERAAQMVSFLGPVADEVLALEAATLPLVFGDEGLSDVAVFNKNFQLSEMALVTDTLRAGGVSEPVLQALRSAVLDRTGAPSPDDAEQVIERFRAIRSEVEPVLVCTRIATEPLMHQLLAEFVVPVFALEALLVGDPGVAMMTRGASRAFDHEYAEVDVLELDHQDPAKVLETFVALRRTTPNRRALAIALDLES